MSKFSGVTRVIFDLDNTLIKHDYEQLSINISEHLGIKDQVAFRRQLDSMFQESSKYIKNKIVKIEYFASIIEKFIPMLKDVGVNGIEFLDMIDRYHTGTLMEDAKEVLDYLYDKGYQIVAFTNWFSKYQLNILKKLGIAEYFERIYSWDDYYAKPNHFAMLRALEGTDAKKNVMIGDDVLGDVILPKSNGVKAIGFNINYGRYVKSVKADADVTRLIDIKKYL